MPTNALALSLFLVAIAPGYVYQRVVERFVVRRDRSALIEAVDLLCVGALCTAIGVLVVLLLGENFPRVFLRLDEVALQSEWSRWQTVGSFAFALALASAIAGGIGVLRVKLVDGSAEMGAGTVWTKTFSAFTSMKSRSGSTASVPLFAVVQLQDGTSIGGQLLMSDTASGHDDRDLTLVSPIWMCRAGESERSTQPHKFVIVRGSEVALIWGYPLLDHVSSGGIGRKGRK